MMKSISAGMIFMEHREIDEIKFAVFGLRSALGARTGRSIEFGAINSPPLFEKISYFPHILIYRP